MPDDRILDEIISSQPEIEDEDEESGDEAMDDIDEANAPRCVRALRLLSQAGISLHELLDDVMMGDNGARALKPVVEARSNLYKSGVLPRVLSRVCRPPDGMKIRGKQHKLAKDEIEKWANNTTVEVLQVELAQQAKSTRAADVESEVVNEDTLKELTFDAILKEVQENTPILFDTLTRICATSRKDENKKRDSKFSITLLINALSYQLSLKSNKMQKLICIYLKAKGVPKSCFFFLQRAGLSLGYDWSRRALEKISAAAMAEVIELFEQHPCIAMHDNIRLAYPIKHERGSHKTVTDNGTAMTIIPVIDKERATKLLWDVNATDQHWEQITKLYREGRASSHQLSASHLYDFPGFQQSGERTTSNIVQFLFQIPGLEKSPKKTHRLLMPLPPIHQLDFTRSHFYMLEPVPMEEQTYSGNYGITKEVPRQLKIDTDEKLQKWAKKKTTPWVGDALTIQRLRQLQRMKAEDSNRLERLQHIIPVFGWMHLDMNLCNAIFYHHYAEGSNSGLARDVAALGRSGLTKPTKSRGPAYHTIDEFMQHVTTARLRGLWLWASGTETIEGLIEWVEMSHPKVIRQAAEKIWLERASSRATDEFKSDSQLCNSIALNRELLLRHEVIYAIRHGDVGRMEHTLPELLFFFSGAGCSNYAREIAEILHWRQFEAPPGVADFIRDECWLINTLGKANTFYPIDLRQELNNLYIKEHGPPPQGCTWESHQKWSPALPVLATVIQHMDESFHDFYRSRKHYVRDAEEDIKLLLKRHAERHIHKPTPDSTTGKEKEKRLNDCFATGRVKIEDKKYLDAVARERIQYFSNLSVLEISERENISLEEAVQMKRREGATGTRVKKKAGSHMDELGEENDEDLLYGYDLHEPAEQEYEGVRHRLGDGLEG